MYWGEITSTVDWCEINYEYSQYIAEIKNSVSSLPIILLGLYYLRKKMLVGLCVMFIGIGSTIFHATLLYEGQLLDEIPMLYLILILFYNVTKLKFASLLIGVLTSILMIKLRGNEYQFIIFHGIFDMIIIIDVLIIIISKKWNIYIKKAVYGLMVGFIVWTLDNVLCNTEWYIINFHALWHYISVYVIYYLTKYMESN